MRTKLALIPLIGFLAVLAALVVVNVTLAAEIQAIDCHGWIKVKKDVEWNGAEPVQDKEFELCVAKIAPSYEHLGCKTMTAQEASAGTELGWYFISSGTYTVWEENPGNEWFVTGGGDIVINGDGEYPMTVTNSLITIDVEKSTNGEDADIGTGPEIPVGGLVSWDYVVTNTGPVGLTNIDLSDDPEGSISCPHSDLNSGESMTCTHTGTASVGQYENLATVTGEYCLPGGTCTPVTDQDPSHYFGEMLDFGDLPEEDPMDFGMTTLANDGARHSLLSDLNLTIGSMKDLEDDGEPDNAALGDDINNVADEEGVYRPTGFNWSDGLGELTVVVGVGGDTTPGVETVGCLTGWLDFHNGAGGGPDASFDDDGEYIIKNVAVMKGENQLTFPLPLDVADDATFFGRFRLVPLTGQVVDGVCQQAPLGYSGAAVGGEVEDQVFVFGPTDISLAGFSAESSTFNIILVVLLAAIGILSLLTLTVSSFAVRRIKA
jgi:hypothetical protein